MMCVLIVRRPYIALAPTYEFAQFRSIVAPIKTSIVTSRYVSDFCVSTAEMTAGEMKSETRLCPSAMMTCARQIKMTFFSFIFHAVPIIQQLFCHMLYFGFLGFSFLIFSLVKVFPSLFGLRLYHITEKAIRHIFVTNRSYFVTNCKNHPCGSRISVVNAPSSLLRERKPSYLLTTSSMLTSPNPCEPSRFVDENSPLVFFSFFPAVKFVNEI